MSGAALATVERAAAEVARVRGWTSRGEHARAAQALDAALRALAEAAETGLPPCVRPLYDRVARDLDTLGSAVRLETGAKAHALGGASRHVAESI